MQKQRINSKKRLLNILLLLSSLFGYMEWGKDQHLFLFQAETEILKKAFENPASVIHPFIIIPFLGQIMLLISILQKTPSRLLTYAAVIALGCILLLLLFIGVISSNTGMIAAAIPFVIISICCFYYYQKHRKGNT